MELFDPHFHIWDLATAEDADGVSNSGHDAKILFPPAGETCYDVTSYEAEFAGCDAIKHIGGVFVEAVSVCHVATPGDAPKFTQACLQEAKWVAASVGGSALPYAVVGTAALESPNRTEVLAQLAKVDGMRGIRQICNHTPDWPRNGMLGELVDNEQWRAGYSELKTVGFSFDLQLNPAQFKPYAAFLAEHPGTTVIINHLGCPTLKDLTETPDIFYSGMEALAACPQTYIKLSMLCYTDPEWDKNPVVLNMVHRVIALFGPERCFFASNFPVETKDNWPATRLFPAYRELAKRYSAEVQHGLFALNARRAYRV